jgi:lysophospholipase L1-like esterase
MSEANFHAERIVNMPTTRARLLCCVALLVLGFDVTAAFATSQTSPDTRNAKKHLIVIGASYAGGWGQPEIPGYRVTNKGIGGDETWRVAARFERDALAASPDAVLIWGHTNDFLRAPAHQYEATKLRAIRSYREMIAQARAAQTPIILTTDIMLPTALTWRDWIPALLAWIRGKESYQARVNREVKAVNEWLRMTAARENIPLLELERVLDDGRGGRKLEYTQEDRSHVSAAGYFVITQYVRGQLRALPVASSVASR